MHIKPIRQLCMQADTISGPSQPSGRKAFFRLLCMVMTVLLLGVMAIVLMRVPVAGSGPHEVILPLPDGCAGCHRAHNSASGSLLGASSHNLLCLTCHDGTGSSTTASTHSNALEESPALHFSPQEEVFTLDCTLCHNQHGPESNSSLVRDTINDSDIVFTARTGADSFDENGGDVSDEDDICVTCHINSTNNSGYPMLSHDGGNHTGTNGYSGDLRDIDCITCHSHDPDNTPSTNDGFMTCAIGGSGCHGLPPDGSSAPNRNGAHATHYTAIYGPYTKRCDDCHSAATVGDGHNDGTVTFSDGQPLATTTACDTCHSPGGTYDGVAEARANWVSGARVSCKGCHDSGTSTIGGVAAPNIAGDGSTYGYYVTGHGMNALVECADCHNADAVHLDSESRTYVAVSTDYQSSYRLAYAMTIPLQSGDGEDEADFALCFECHHYEGVFDSSSPFLTNFRSDMGMGKNLHVTIKHLANSADQWDSDWNTPGWQTGLDSRASCPTCHNVHGSATSRMTRHGELTGFSLDFSSTDTQGSCSDPACHTAAKNYQRTPITEGLTDLHAPEISAMNPQNGDTDVPRNSSLTFTLSDSEMGVDWTSFEIQLTGNRGYNQTYTDADTGNVSKTGTAASYDVTVTPAANYAYGEMITVNVNVTDLSPWANALSAPPWSFVVHEDTTPPSITDLSPLNASADVPLDSDLTFTLSDNETGVGWASFSIEITGSGYLQTYTDESSEVSETGSQASYDVVVNPSVDFPNGTTITVTVVVSDQAWNPNTLNYSAWTFTTVNTPPEISGVGASQSTDGTRVVTISYTGTDADNDACTYVLADCEYSLDSTDGLDGTWLAMTRIDSGSEAFTSSGASLSYEWDVGTDAPDIEDGSVWVRLKVNDGADDSSLATIGSAFAVDTKPPINVADFQGTASDETSITLSWTPASDGNFDHYEIWYDVAGGINREGSNTEWDDSDDLNLANVATGTTTIIGLDSGTTYFFKIWTVDGYGNEIAGTEVSYATQTAG